MYVCAGGLLENHFLCLICCAFYFVANFFFLRLDFTYIFSSRMVDDQDEVVCELDDDLASPLMDCTFLMDPCQVGKVRGVSLVQTLYQKIQ